MSAWGTVRAKQRRNPAACNGCLDKFRRLWKNSERKLLTDLRLVLKTLREMTNVEALTPTVVNTLIERIEIHANEKKHSHNGVKVDIYFTAMGIIGIPTEQEITKLMAEIQKDLQRSRIVA